jgi:hypothetical protein
MEGYWLTHFETGKRSGDGIAMLHAGDLVGGDLKHLWNGSYEEDGTKVTAKIRVIPVVARRKKKSGTREALIVVSLNGYCTEDFARLEGGAELRPDLHFDITMRKCKGALAAPHSPQPELEAKTK